MGSLGGILIAGEWHTEDEVQEDPVLGVHSR